MPGRHRPNPVARVLTPRGQRALALASLVLAALIVATWSLT